MATAKYFTIGRNHKRKIDSQLSVHAEHDCIVKFERKNKYTRNVSQKDKIDLICIRYSKSGKLGNSRPCMGCIKRMGKCSFNIRNVYYSTSEGIITRERFDEMDKQITFLSSGQRARVGITREMHEQFLKDPCNIPCSYKKFYKL